MFSPTTMRRVSSLAGLVVLAMTFAGLDTAFAQSDASAEESPGELVLGAARAGDAGALAELVRAHRLSVKPAVEGLITESMRATLRGDQVRAEQNLDMAAAIAGVFEREFGETSLRRAVDQAGRWTADKASTKLKADSLSAEGTALRGKSDTRSEAYRRYEEALRLYRHLGDLWGEGTVLGGMGFIWWYAGDRDSTQLYFEQALAVRKAADDRLLVGNSLNDLGSVRRLFFDDYTGALSYYLEAEALRTDIGDEAGLGRTLGYVAYVYERLGDRGRALGYYERAAELNQRLGDVGRAAEAWTSAGVVLKDLGRYSDALARLEAALTIRKDQGELDRATDVLNWIGVVHRWLGDYESALTKYQEVIRLATEAGNEAVVGQAMSNIGVVYLSADRPERATEYFLRALDKFDASGDDAGALAATLNLASSYFEQGRYAEAEPHLLKALDASLAGKDRLIEARTLILLGNVLNRTGRLDEAVRRHEESLAIGREISVPDLLWGSHLGLGDDYDRLGDFEAAVEHYDMGFETLEDMRSSLVLEEDKADYLAQQRYAFEEVVTTMSRWHESAPEKGYDQLAFRYAEQAKARAFLDLLAEALSNVREGIDPALLEEQKRLLAERSRVQHELKAAEDDSVRQSLQASARELDDSYRVLQREMYLRNPRYSALQYPGPVTLDEIQQGLLAEDDVLLEYSLGDSSTTLWAVARGRRSLYRLAGREEIEAQVEIIRRGLSDPTQTDPAVFAGTAYRLYELLLKPAESLIEGARRLIIVPDGSLFYLPFEALVTAPAQNPAGYGELPFLVRDHAVVYGQSAGVLMQIRGERSRTEAADGRQLLAFGDPAFGSPNADGSDLERLAFSGTEVESIAALFASGQVDTYLRADASETRAKAMAGYRFIHFATHGLIDDRRPDFSSVALAGSEGEDGLLQAAEIFNLRIDADLVVLSACQTGLGKMVRGEGMIGLTRAFMYAGAPSLVVSLWRVADMSTSQLMTRFYEALVTRGLDKAEALRRAKLTLLEDETLAHPFSWAPFILIGDWD